jgi:hypothetical protein
MVPIFSIIVLPYATVMGCRFILQTMVHERHSKKKDTMKIMSLTDFSYGLSIFIFQIGFCVLGGIVLSFFIFNQKYLFPAEEEHVMGKSLLFIFVMIQFNIGQQAISMALSTLFNDPQVSSYIGSFLLALPIVLYLQLIVNQSELIYLFFWLPHFPAATLFCKLTTSPDNMFLLTDPHYISSLFSWVCLVSLPVFWFCVYLYLDKVVPGEYGVA